MSLEMSHGRPARVCGEVIAHRDIRDHMEHLYPLATSSSGSCVAELSLARNDASSTLHCELSVPQNGAYNGAVSWHSWGISNLAVRCGNFSVMIISSAIM